jgi:hypothetical protein
MFSLVYACVQVKKDQVVEQDSEVEMVLVVYIG